MQVTASAWVTALGLFAAYLRAAGRSTATIRLRCYYVDRLARDTAAPDPWSLTVDDLIVWLSEPTWSAETRKAARASICSFYRWAIDTDRLPPDDSPARRLPAISVPRGMPRPAPTVVLTRALFVATDRDRLFLMLAAYAGLRRDEIARFHPDWIDREAMEFVVPGKGGRERKVPCHPELLEAIDAELGRRRAGRCGTGWRYYRACTPDGHLFPGERGRAHISADRVGRVLARLLGDMWTGHTLRHRFATKAYSAERDLRAVQELLGHSKPETTARYVQTPPDAMRAAVMASGVTAA